MADDLSQYSIEELHRMLGEHDQQPSSDLSSMPTEELQKLVAEDEKPEDSWRKISADTRGEIAAGLRGVRKSLPFGQDIDGDVHRRLD